MVVPWHTSVLTCGFFFFFRFGNQGGPTARFETVCSDCPGWDQCIGCTVHNGNNAPVCWAPLEHTTVTEPGSTLEALNIEGGYWRATNTSDIILACHNADACSGGVSGADGFCASGYTGPCERENDEKWRA